jgi:hypothetical protein
MKIAANGLRINVRDRGRGEPSLVFLHYWGGSSRTWDEVIDQKERVIEDSLRGAAAAKHAWPTQAMLEDIRSGGTGDPAICFQALMRKSRAGGSPGEWPANVWQLIPGS